MTTHENFASYGSGCTGYGFDAEVTYSNALAEECKGDPGFGIHHIPYEKQLQYFLDVTLVAITAPVTKESTRFFMM